MSRYFESIRVVNNRSMNLSGHQKRIDRTLGTKKHSISLKKYWKEIKKPGKGTYKWRVSYNQDSITKASFEKYKEKVIETLRLVEVGDISYKNKEEDRGSLDKAFAQKENCDDILMLRKGFLSDSYYCNIALWDGENWWTPEDSLLEGTMQAKLLERGTIRRKKIHLFALPEYKKIRLFNAMIPWSKRKEILVDGLRS